MLQDQMTFQEGAVL